MSSDYRYYFVVRINVTIVILSINAINIIMINIILTNAMCTYTLHTIFVW